MEIESFFQRVNAQNIGTIGPQFYREDIQFRDPMVSLQGRDQLITYYQKMYEGAEDVTFAFGEHLCEGDTHMLNWKMTITAPRLNHGKPFNVDGMSQIKMKNGLAYYHRDYFDLSTMFYEKLPVVGGIVEWLKKKATM